MKDIKFVLERANEGNEKTIVSFRRQLLTANDIEEKYHTPEVTQPLEKGYYIFLYKSEECIGMFEFFRYSDLYNNYRESIYFENLEDISQLPDINKTGHLRTSIIIEKYRKIFFIPMFYIHHILSNKKGCEYIIIGIMKESVNQLIKRIGFNFKINEISYNNKNTSIYMMDNKYFFNNKYSKKGDLYLKKLSI